MLTAKQKLRSILNNMVSQSNLAAKWAPRLASSKKATTAGKKVKLQNAKDLSRFMMLSPKKYRQILVGATNVVENLMCAKQWNEINFSHVPSLASARYQKAFGKNASEAYSAYIRELQKPQDQRDPKVKINAGAVYPYDVIKSLRMGNAAVADAQFDALPNFVGDAKILPMVDVSGSMGVPLAGTTTAMDVAISLGLYLSHNTSSDFKDMFLTFSGNSKIQTLKGSLSQKFTQLSRAEWQMNTNLHSAFEEVLRVAKAGNVSQENMPDYIILMSDMQFDSCVRHDNSALEMVKRKYREAGYKMPAVIFWNLAARISADQSPIKMNDRGVAIVSGFSPSIMAMVLGANPDDYTPYAMMMKVINNSRYDF